MLLSLLLEPEGLTIGTVTSCSLICCIVSFPRSRFSSSSDKSKDDDSDILGTLFTKELRDDNLIRMAVEVDFGSATETFVLHMPNTDLATKVPNLQIQAAPTVNPNSRYGLELYSAWVSEFDFICSKIISTNYNTSQQQITDYFSQRSTGIPTAIVIGGYNGSDHNQFYDSFTSNHPNSVVIKSASSVKDLISQIVISLCGKQPHYCDHDISRLSAISGRILVIVPQFEMVGHGILSKCVQMFGASGLAFGLVFGVATTGDVLHQQLTKASCCLLETKTFKLVDSKTIIDQIITHTLLITSVPFQKADCNIDHESNQDSVMGKLKLGRTVFRTIMTKFLSYDHSVQNFCSGIKYAIMSMLYENPLACFLDPYLILENVNSQTFEMVRLLPSFQTFIESTLKNNVEDEKRNAIAVLEQDSCLFELVKNQLQQLYVQDLLSAAVFNAVLKLQELFSNQSCKKPVYYIYNLVLSGNIGDSDYVQNSILLLRFQFLI